MTKPIIRIHNAETGEVVDREMTDAEFATFQAEQLAKTTKETELAAQAAAKQALLDKLGITAEEAKLLLS